MMDWKAARRFYCFGAGCRPFLVPLFVFSVVPYCASFGEQEAVATVRSES